MEEYHPQSMAKKNCSHSLEDLPFPRDPSLRKNRHRKVKLELNSNKALITNEI